MRYIFYSFDFLMDASSTHVLGLKARKPDQLVSLMEQLETITVTRASNVYNPVAIFIYDH